MNDDCLNTSRMYQRALMRVLTLISLVILNSVGNLLAADIPGFDRTVTLSAKEQNVAEFIQSLFSQIGVPVSLDTEIPGRVNGRFTGSAGEVFEQISGTFNVHVYFNRSVAYIYRADQITQTLLPLNTAQAQVLQNIVQKMNLSDAHNVLNAIQGVGLEVIGTTRFVKKVEEIANTVISNTNSAAKATAAVSAVVERTRMLKPKKPELTVREFKLKFATVNDATLTIAGQEVLIPGVASILRQFIDRERSPDSIMAASDSSTNSNFASSDDEMIQAQPLTRFKRDHPAPPTEARIMVHPQTNSVWIEDTVERMPVYEAMIKAMDKEPRMVEIEATIIDINNTKQRELGVNWRAFNGDTEFLLGNGTPSDQALYPGAVITPQGSGGILSMVLGDRTRFIARMRALEELGAAKIVSKPHVITLSNVEAVLGSTTEFFVRLEGKDAVGLERQTFGTVLRVTPRVFEDDGVDGINLLITIEDGSATDSQVDSIPGIERSIVATQTLVSQGQSLLLGGLVRESSNKQHNKVPLLGDIPGIGKLFQSVSRNTSKTERLFLITPRIVSEQAVLNGNQGPVLLGEQDDVISSSDRRSEAGAVEVDLKAERHREAVEGESLLHKPVELINQTLLDEPIAPDAVHPYTHLRDLLIIPVAGSTGSSDDSSMDMVETISNRWQVRDWDEQETDWQEVGR